MRGGTIGFDASHLPTITAPNGSGCVMTPWWTSVIVSRAAALTQAKAHTNVPVTVSRMDCIDDDETGENCGGQQQYPPLPCQDLLYVPVTHKMTTSIEVCNTICSKTFCLFLDYVFLSCVSLINKGTCKPCPSAVMGPAQQDTVVCTVPEAVRGASTRDLSITVQASPVYMCLFLRLSLSLERCVCLSFRLLKRMSLESVFYFESFSLLSSVCVHKHIIANGGSFDPSSLFLTHTLIHFLSPFSHSRYQR